VLGRRRCRARRVQVTFDKEQGLYCLLCLQYTPCPSQLNMRFTSAVSYPHQRTMRPTSVTLPPSFFFFWLRSVQSTSDYLLPRQPAQTFLFGLEHWAVSISGLFNGVAANDGRDRRRGDLDRSEEMARPGFMRPGRWVCVDRKWRVGRRAIDWGKRSVMIVLCGCTYRCYRFETC
jgi:hypothetical protein